MTKLVLSLAAVSALALVAGCDTNRRSNDTSYATPTPGEPKSNLNPPKDEIPGGTTSAEPTAPPPAAPAAPAGPNAYGGGPLALDGAIDRLAEARCDLARKCAETGKGKKEGDLSKCMDKSRTTMAKGLDEKSCPKGIEMGALQTCLDEIRNESCSDPFDIAGRVEACRSTTLCAK